MPRPRSFEPKDALDQATQVFWAKGFDHTSYNDLVKATGVSRKGLYSAFGDKDDLFLKVLRHYRASFVPERFGPLFKKDVTLPEIKRLLSSFAENATKNDPSYLGCLMVNTAGEATINKPEVRAIYNHHVMRLGKEFSSALARAGLSADEAERLGDYCAGIIQGLLLLARAKVDNCVINNFMDTALDELG